MHSKLRDAFCALAGAGAMAVVFYTAMPVLGQQKPATTAGIPRLNGKPDLGVWQALNSANWDLEAHSARPALAMRPGPIVPVPAKEVIAFGAVGSVPGGMGVVEGGEIPYTAEARKKKEENQANWLSRDPEIKCYLPGVPRATYVPFPFQIFQSNSAFAIAYEYAGAYRNIYLKIRGHRRSIPGWDNRSVAGMVTPLYRGYERISRPELVRPLGQPPHRAAEGQRALHDDRRDHIQYEATIEDPACSRGLEDEHAALPQGGSRRAARPVQVRRVRGRTDARAVSQGADPMKRVLTFGTPALAVVAAVFLSPGIGASPNAVDQSSTGGGQAPASIAKPVMPRATDGKPDLQGTWSNATLTPLERGPKESLILTDEAAGAYRGPHAPGG